VFEDIPLSLVAIGKYSGEQVDEIRSESCSIIFGLLMSATSCKQGVVVLLHGRLNG